MTTYEAIKLLIEEDIHVDIHGDLYGHEGVAEHLAERFDMLQQQIDELEAKLAKCEEKCANASWAEDYRRGMSF